MRLIVTAAVAALAFAFAGTAVQAKAKKEKIETFKISCPALAPVPMNMGTCRGTRASCQTKHQMCYVQSQKKAKKAKKHKSKKKAKK